MHRPSIVRPPSRPSASDASISSAHRSAATAATTWRAGSGNAPMTTGMPALMMPAFSNAMASSVWPSRSSMVEPDRGNGASRGRNDIRRVEATAQAHLDHRDFHARAAEQLERDGGRGFEECRVDGQLALIAEVVRRSRAPRPRRSRDHRRSTGSVPMTNRSARFTRCGDTYLRRPDARGDERRMHHCRHGTLTVGAGDMKRRKRPLGMIERRAQSRDVLETELDSERFEREEAIEQFSAVRRPTAAATGTGGSSGGGFGAHEPQHAPEQRTSSHGGRRPCRSCRARGGIHCAESLRAASA